MKDCQNRPIVAFGAIECSLPTTEVNLLSSDQKYLFNICHAIKLRVCGGDLGYHHPGNLNHSRWLTKANRILRTYISTERPDYNLRLLVEFIMKVYAPSWFEIKLNSSIKDGARNLSNIIRTSRYLPEQYLQIVDTVISRNAFFAFPENIL